MVQSIFGLCLVRPGEQHRATKFGRLVLLSLPSRSSKFRVLLHSDDIIARCVTNVQRHVDIIFLSPHAANSLVLYLAGLPSAVC